MTVRLVAAMGLCRSQSTSKLFLPVFILESHHRIGTGGKLHLLASNRPTVSIRLFPILRDRHVGYTGRPLVCALVALAILDELRRPPLLVLANLVGQRSRGRSRPSEPAAMSTCTSTSICIFRGPTSPLASHPRS